MDANLQTLPEAETITNGLWLACIDCGETYKPFAKPRYRCSNCHGLLEVRYTEYNRLSDFAGSKMDRYQDVLPTTELISIQEGGTPLYAVTDLEPELSCRSLRVKHEGMNPTGSFKDRGMAVGVKIAEKIGVHHLGCASTGNTSAALACYGSKNDNAVTVLLPEGNVAEGKIAQAKIHGANILAIEDNFDACLRLVSELATEGTLYLLNSMNPYRLEGQKTIGYEILEEFHTETGQFPDKIVLPVGNAGNVAAIHKAFRELQTTTTFTQSQIPELIGVQAEGAAPFVDAIQSGATTVTPWESVQTRASAIQIGDPVNAPKAMYAIKQTNGTAIAVSDEAILNAQQQLAKAGIGVEPASAASLAGLKQLDEQGMINEDDDVVCLATGHLLKDPEIANQMDFAWTTVPPDIDSVRKELTTENNDSGTQE
ncbi:MAG: threonine synthase [Halobacteriaceae archaeon]